MKAKRPILALVLLLLVATSYSLVVSDYMKADVNHSSKGLTAISPLNESTDVCVATKIRASFTDPISRSSLQKGFSIEPSGGRYFLLERRYDDLCSSYKLDV